MPSENGSSGIWKIVAGVLIAVVITGLTTWLGFAKDAPDRDEVTTMIDRGACQEDEVRRIVIESSPYQQDKGVIKKSIGDLEAQVDSMENKVDGLRTQQTKLVERIDSVLKVLPLRIAQPIR